MSHTSSSSASLLSLPNELLVLTGLYLTPKDLFHVILTNRRLHSVVVHSLHSEAIRPHDDLPPLHYACSSGQAKLVAYLLHHGFDPDAFTNDGYTPLYYSAQSGSREAVQHLLDAGANVDAVNAGGNTAAHTAVTILASIDRGVSTTASIEKADRVAAVLKLLCQMKAGLAIRNDKGQVAMDLAPGSRLGRAWSVIQEVIEMEKREWSRKYGVGMIPRSRGPLWVVKKSKEQ